MKDWFSYDGNLVRIMTKVMYIVSLNLMVLMSGIGIITIGASLVAMNSVLFQYIKGEESGIIKVYLRAFRQNFTKATLVWGILLAMAFTLVSNHRFFAGRHFYGKPLIDVFLTGVSILWVIAVVYVFPVMAYFENSIRGYFTFVIGLAIAKLHVTIVLFVVQTVPLLLLLYLAQYFQIAVILLICNGISLPAYFSCQLLLRLFEKELVDAGKV